MNHARFLIYFLSMATGIGATALCLAAYLTERKKILKRLFLVLFTTTLHSAAFLFLIYASLALSRDAFLVQLISSFVLCLTIYTLLNFVVCLANDAFGPSYGCFSERSVFILSTLVFLVIPIVILGNFLRARFLVVPFWYSIVFNTTIFLIWLYPCCVYASSLTLLQQKKNRGLFHRIMISLLFFLPGLFFDSYYKVIFRPLEVGLTLFNATGEDFLFYPYFFFVFHVLLCFHFTRKGSEDVAQNGISAPHDGLLSLEVNSFRLTEREKEISFLILQGASYEEIARKLFISKTTVKTHMKNICEKAQVRNRIELMVVLNEVPLVPVSPIERQTTGLGLFP